MVLRAQVFTGDALSHVAFTGALAALAAGADLLIGLYGACIVVALAMAVLGPSGQGQADDTVDRQRLRLDPRARRALPDDLHDLEPESNGTSGVQRPVRHHLRALGQPGHDRHAGVASASALAVVVIARPLLFASVDTAVARAKRVPVRLLGADLPRR